MGHFFCYTSSELRDNNFGNGLLAERDVGMGASRHSLTRLVVINDSGHRYLSNQTSGLIFRYLINNLRAKSISEFAVIKLANFGVTRKVLKR